MPEVRGISTYKTYLMFSTNDSASMSKLIDITSFPDLVPPSDRIDITTLSDYMRVYINGIGDTSEMQFGANYTPANYKAVKAQEGKQNYYAVWFGDSGSLGKFSWTGDISAGISGGGVNEAVGMTINCTPSTVITFAES